MVAIDDDAGAVAPAKPRTLACPTARATTEHLFKKIEAPRQPPQLTRVPKPVTTKAPRTLFVTHTLRPTPCFLSLACLRRHYDHFSLHHQVTSTRPTSTLFSIHRHIHHSQYTVQHPPSTTIRIITHVHSQRINSSASRHRVRDAGFRALLRHCPLFGVAASAGLVTGQDAVKPHIGLSWYRALLEVPTFYWQIRLYGLSASDHITFRETSH